MVGWGCEGGEGKLFFFLKEEEGWGCVGGFVGLEMCIRDKYLVFLIFPILDIILQSLLSVFFYCFLLVVIWLS